MPSGYDEAPRSVVNGTSGFKPASNRRQPVHDHAAARSHTTGSIFDVKGKEAQLLDVMDKLRDLSTRHQYPLPDLPQIIVCGSQTAGKSSVLEAIAEIPFPRSTGVCTKYVTRVTLERKEDGMIRMEIIPDKTRPETEKKSLALFKKEILLSQWKNDELGLMNDAVKEVDSKIFDGSRKGKTWTKDILSMTISAPDKRPLQVLDLPGLIGHDKNNEGNIELVEEIVVGEMMKPHCLILAVVEGQDDINKHIILEKCNKYDAHGKRTIVVVTKLDSDLAEPNQETYIDKINEEDKTYDCRWHVLRNRSQEEIKQKTTNQARDQKEREFFDRDPWDKVDGQFKGIEELRRHLRDKLFSMARDKLPKLRQSMQDRSDILSGRLKVLGGENTDPDNLRKILQITTSRLRRKARDHARRIYEHDITHFSAENPVFLRSRVVRQNWTFHDDIIRDGQHWERFGNRGVDPDRDLKSNLDAPTNVPDGSIIRSREMDNGSRILSEEDEHKMAEELLILKQGRELQGQDNSDRINDLSWKLSKKWQQMTKRHIEDVCTHCENYFKVMTPLAFAQSSETEADGFHNSKPVAIQFVKYHVLPGLEERKKRAMEELDRLEVDRRESAQNYNRGYMKDYRQQSNVRGFSLATQAVNRMKEAGQGGELTPDVYASYQSRHSQEDKIKETGKDFLNATWINYLVSFSRGCRGVTYNA
jgi:hypothetical protein